MKNKIILFAIFISFNACTKAPQNKMQQDIVADEDIIKKVEVQNKVTSPLVINVYYFHGNRRCATCRNMENYSREILSTYFRNEIESGKIKFKTINIDEENNRHYVKDYNLYTKTLILSVTKEGKEITHKDLDKIWEYARNKQKFTDYVKSEVSKELAL